MPNSNLHLYSKVLNPLTAGKRDIPVCQALKWEQPVYLNVTTTKNVKEDHFQSQNIPKLVDDIENSSNLLRKLESQKGEVSSVSFLSLTFLLQSLHSYFIHKYFLNCLLIRRVKQ